jgi:asparagine synthase (glutamine-hydrolysing)
MKVINSNENINENDLFEKSIKRHKNGKVVLRKTLSKYLGDKITKSQKQGFSSPDASWFRGESIEYVKKTLASSILSGENIFNKESLENYIDEHLNGMHNHRLFIWSFLNLEKAFQRFFR